MADLLHNEDVDVHINVALVAVAADWIVEERVEHGKVLEMPMGELREQARLAEEDDAHDRLALRAACVGVIQPGRVQGKDKKKSTLV